VIKGGSSRGELYSLTGARIREARQRRKLSQSELAAAVGLTRTSIVNIERGRQKILLHTLFDFAEALDVHPGTLIPNAVTLPAHGAEQTLPKGLSSDAEDFIRYAIGRTRRTMTRQ
jgi:transcriptional regulator with XRE-family HTH domain